MYSWQRSITTYGLNISSLALSEDAEPCHFSVLWRFGLREEIAGGTVVEMFLWFYILNYNPNVQHFRIVRDKPDINPTLYMTRFGNKSLLSCVLV